MYPGRPNGGEESLRKDLEALSVSQRLVRSVRQKWKKKKKKKKNYRDEAEEEDGAKGVSMRCLTLYGRGGGCKVGADTWDGYGDPNSRRRSSCASEEGKLYRPICGNEDSGLDCFSYGVRDKFWKKIICKDLELEASVQNSRLHIFLPDDILELCLVRLPLTSLMNARLVCKKWRHLTTTPRFLRLRSEGSFHNPWLFLFGAVKDGCYSGEIHALDVSQDHWHRIDSGILRGRFMFSVASVLDDIYIVGGCSNLIHFGRVDRSTFKTHKGAIVFSPLTKSWQKIASMKYARSMPIIGISEVSSDFSVTQSHHQRQERRFPRSRVGGVSDVYEDPHRLSLRRNQSSTSSEENEVAVIPNRKSHRFIRQRGDRLNTKCSRKLILVAIGGFGSWDEPLDSGEIYDPMTNKWTEIQKLPIDFGVACCGVICNGIFYVYSETDKLMGYDVEMGYWIGIQTSPFPPRVYEYYPKLVSCNGGLFMLSVSWCEGDGQIGQRNKAVRKLWELDLIHLTWSVASVHPDAPMDWNAAFVAEKNLIFGVEMFRIFGQVLDFLTVCNVSEDGLLWRHVSRNHMAHQLDASSCMTKSIALVNL